MADYKKKVNIDLGDALKAMEALTVALDAVTNSLKNVDEEAEDAGDTIEDLGKKSEKATDKGSKGFTGLGKSIGGVIKSLGIIGIAFAVFDKFVETLKKNKKFADALSTAVNFVEIALGKIIDNSIDPLIKGFEKIFNDPQKAVKNLGNFIKENISNRLEGLLELIPALGKAIELAWEGEWTEAAKVAADAALKVSTGVENATDKILDLTEGIIEFTEETLKSAQAQTELDNALATSAARQEALKIEAQRAAEVQRQIRDDESKSIDERLAANEKLGQILRDQALDEKAIASESLTRAKQAITNGDSSIEAENKLLEAKNRIAEIDERIAGQNSEQIVNNISLRKEELQSVFDQIDAETELLNVGAEKAQQFENEKLALQAKLVAIEEAGLVEIEEYRKTKEAIALIDAEIKVFNDEQEEEAVIKEEEAAVKKQKLLDKELEDEKKLAEEKKKLRLDVAAASLQAASSLTTAVAGLVNQQFQNEIKAAEGNEKKQEKIRKKQFEANKALQIVTAVIGTAAAVVSTAAQLGFPAAIPGIIAAAALGAVQIATIASAKYSPTGGSSGGSRPQVPAPPNISAASNQGPNVSFTGSGNNLNTVGGGVEELPVPTINANVTISETEITGTQNTVSEYENNSLLSG